MMVRKVAFCLMLVFSLNIFAVSAQDDLATEVRFGHFAADAPNVDVFFNGDVMFEDYEPSWLSGFVEVEPGTLDVVVAPAGEGVENPLVKVGRVEIEDGHGYTISLIGQAFDDSLHGLVIDETEEIGNCDMSENVFRITINNIAGAPPISFYEGDQWIETNIEYGDYAAECVPVFFADTARAVANQDLNDPLFVFDDEEDGFGGFWEPYMVYLWGMMGEYPGDADEDYYFGGGDWYTLAPDPITFLEAYSGKGMTYDSEIYLEFDQVLEAIRTAGLEDMLRNEGPFTLFVPTDQALQSLPAKTLDRLMSDPDALRDALLYHMIEGQYYADDLLDAGTMEAMQGSELEFTADEDNDDHFFINGEAQVEDFEYPILDGSTVYFITNLSFLTP